MALRDRLVDACRVPATVEERSVGLWSIRRFQLPLDSRDDARQLWRAFGKMGAYEEYTCLFRTTEATLMSAHGECVMDDSPLELRRHLPILLAAHGRVLITGLGLGCVVRGLLSKPDVEHIDVVEIDPSIVRLVGQEFADDPRITLHMGDARTVDFPASSHWDFAWHDVWEEHDALAVTHGQLLKRFHSLADRQGAWQFPRLVKRRWPRPLLGGPAVAFRTNRDWNANAARSGAALTENDHA